MNVNQTGFILNQDMEPSSVLEKYSLMMQKLRMGLVPLAAVRAYQETTILLGTLFSQVGLLRTDV